MKRLVAVGIVAIALAIPSTAGAALLEPAASSYVPAPHGQIANAFCSDCIPPPPSSGTPGVQITFGWVIYVHLSYAETGNVLVTAFITGMFGAVAYLCGVIGGFLAPVCLGVLAFVGYYIISVMNTAYHQLHDGVVIELTYGLSFFGIMAVPDSWT
jgi:hypothetical protein